MKVINAVNFFSYKMLSRQMTKVIDTIKTAFDSGKSLLKRVFFLSVAAVPC